MSVIKSNRAVSDTQFLYLARELESKTRRRCLSAPKRFTFYGLQELWLSARRTYEGVKKGNSVYPHNQHEVQIRRDFFICAGVELQNYISQLELLVEDGVFSPETIRELSDIVNQEIRLIKAVIKSDKDRYSNLP